MQSAEGHQSDVPIDQMSRPLPIINYGESADRVRNK